MHNLVGVAARSLAGPQRDVYALGLGRSAAGLVASSSDGRLALLDPRGLEDGLVAGWDTGHVPAAAPQVADPAGWAVCTAGDDGAVAVWDLRAAATAVTPAARFKGESGPGFWTVIFSRAGSLLWTCLIQGSRHPRNVQLPRRRCSPSLVTRPRRVSLLAPSSTITQPPFLFGKGPADEAMQANSRPTPFCYLLGPIAHSISCRDLRSTSAAQAQYNEVHSDDITALAFHPTEPALLLSGSTDGLVNVYDTRVADEDEVTLQTFNHDASIHCAGFLTGTELLALSHDEQFALYDMAEENPTGNATRHFGDLRRLLGCQYVADVTAKTDGSGAIVGAGAQE